MISKYKLIFNLCSQKYLLLWKCLTTDFYGLSESILIIACCALALSQAFDLTSCLNAPPTGYVFVPSSISCNHYVLCWNGETHLDNCPPNHDFNVGDQNCGIIGTVDCTQCHTSVGVINIPDPNDCGAFIECMFGLRTLRTCTPGHLFDRLLGSCNRADLVDCPGGFPTEDPNQPGTDYPGQTPPGPITEFPPLTPPGPDPETTPPGPGEQLPVCIPGGQIQHAHPTDCRRFFMCNNNILMEHLCPSDLHWNEREMACDLVENAMCFRSAPQANFVPEIGVE